MLVNEGTVSALYELITTCFYENRMYDRFVSVLNTKFAMNNTSNLCHLGISHMFPILADKIGEKCLERYNISVEYGLTPEAKTDYNSAEEIIRLMNDEAIKFQNMFIGCMVIAQQNQDLQCYADLLELLQEYNKVVEQTILLVDKLDLYNGNMASYDAHIKSHFWIL